MVALNPATEFKSGSYAPLVPRTAIGQDMTGGVYSGTRTQDSETQPKALIEREVDRFAGPAVGSQHVTERVEGVIGFVGPVTVTISISRPEGDFEVRFPVSVVPSELRHFGQPVTVSLSRDSGVRAPQISARQIVYDGQDADIDEMAEWLATE